MKDSILNKLNNLIDRYEEIAGLLADPDVIGDQHQFRDLSMEYAQLEPVVNCYQDYTSAQHNLKSADEMLADNDPEIREMASEEKASASAAGWSLWKSSCKSCYYPKTRMTTATFSWRYAPVPAAMRPPFSLAIYSACIAVMPKYAVGKWKY